MPRPRCCECRESSTGRCVRHRPALEACAACGDPVIEPYHWTGADDRRYCCKACHDRETEKHMQPTTTGQGDLR